MLPIDSVPVEVSVVLGHTTLPIGQLVRMGRGALIELEARQNDPVYVYADTTLVARGELIVKGDRLAVAVVETMPVAPPGEAEDVDVGVEESA